ncbi:Class I SAM-dependent methyltransferase [Sulfidibacter corallicola]|uniref:Class I SAM-dependent methyltransferase n=1 Tax=Sulfidibacter corallicola TaxID=2818388 RepID=A0A8A4THN3_SULCO|nr:class I SAM-dependent methyltransferase [Sulfidibacter corallicola]QTD49436.1 class I SAM-dependent methyltransferase [Sulfidibacter corallicola]
MSHLENSVIPSPSPSRFAQSLCMDLKQAETPTLGFRSKDHLSPTWREDAPRMIANLVEEFAAIYEHILDLRCGDGLLGAELHRRGFHRITGLHDDEPELRLAQARNHYQNLVHSKLKAPLPFLPLSFDIVTYTHLDQGRFYKSLLSHICRLIRPGGHLILTLTEAVYQYAPFQNFIKELLLGGNWTWAFISVPHPYRSGPERARDALVARYLVFEILDHSGMSKKGRTL